MNYVLLILISYIIGSIPTGWILVKVLTGHEIRYHGSKNIGFTNVSRVIGLGLGLVVLAIDVGKSFVLVNWLAPYIGGSEAHYQVLAGIICILGNIFTIWFANLKGGKAIATATGVFMALLPINFLAALGFWLLVLLLTKFISLSSIIAVFYLYLSYFYSPSRFTLFSNQLWSKDLVVILIFVLVIMTHRENIERLLAGKEKVIKFKKAR